MKKSDLIFCAACVVGLAICVNCLPILPAVVYGKETILLEFL